MINSKHILDTHKDRMLHIQKVHSTKSLTLQSLEMANKQYEKVEKDLNELRHEIGICEEDLLNHVSSLSVLEAQYLKLKEGLQEDLEKRLTDTVNLWYNENVNLKFIRRGTSSKDKRKSVRLIDINKGVPLEGITGGAACQTVGLLVSICIARMRGLNFLLLDEPFSNFNSVSAEKVPDLLNSVLGDMQVVLIENKETVLDQLNSYTYSLDKEIYEEHGETKSKSIITEIINGDLYKQVQPEEMRETERKTEIESNEE